MAVASDSASMNAQTSAPPNPLAVSVSPKSDSISKLTLYPDSDEHQKSGVLDLVFAALVRLAARNEKTAAEEANRRCRVSGPLCDLIHSPENERLCRFFGVSRGTVQCQAEKRAEARESVGSGPDQRAADGSH